MRIPVKIAASGFSLPALGLGTWQMGGRDVRDQKNDDARDVAAIRMALDMGITHIDTAEAYADGYAEELVGEAIKGRDRNQIILVSKVSPEHLKYDDILRAHEDSLRRLGTDYLDLYLIHHPSTEIPLQESMRALNRLVDNGSVRAIGVSNFNVDRLREAQYYSDSFLPTVQAHYNLMTREVEASGLLQYCQEKGIILTAWRPLEKGIILNTKDKLIQNLCKKYEITSPQLAIAWLTAQTSVVTLVKTSNPNHLQENLASVDISLSSEEIDSLRQNYKPQVTVSPSVPLG